MAVRGVFVLLTIACCIMASPFGIEKLVNITIPVPDQTQIYNDPKQICIPPKWSDYLVFYFGNYLAHVATVQTYPGESRASTLKALGLCLLFPASGISRGLTTIIRCAIHQKTPLQTAARAGALCMVVRTKDWLPATGDFQIDGLIVRATMKSPKKTKPKRWSGIWMLGKLRYTAEHISNLPMKSKMLEDGSPYDDLQTPRRLRVYWTPWAQELSKYWNYYDTSNEHINPQQKVHGFCRLSEGYSLAHVPRDAVVHPWSWSSSGGPYTTQYPSVHEISATYSFPKAFIAVVQLIFASFTLYESFGNQITKYGYAAFGLTVTPYALMSLINLLGSLLTPSFPALYLVHSSVLDEAKGRGSAADGVVGVLVELETPKVEGTELITGRFTSRTASKDAAGSVATALQQVQFKFQVPSSYLWSQNTTLNIITEGISDPMAPAVFVPSCPCFERQGKYQYELLRRSGYETLNGKWNPEGKRERDRFKDELGAAPMATMLVSTISIGIIGTMSGFHARESTILQRFITMAWVTSGIYIGSTLSYLLIMLKEMSSSTNIWLSELFLQKLLERPKSYYIPRQVKLQRTITGLQKFQSQASQFLAALMYCAPSIAGFVLVGLMIRDYGACITIGK